MSWFRRRAADQIKPTFCRECSLAFKPRMDDDFPDHCLKCAEPLRKIKARMELVRRYAEHNWKALEPKAIAWEKKQLKAFAASSGAGARAQENYFNGLYSHGAHGGIWYASGTNPWNQA